MDAHALPAWGLHSDHDSLGVPSLVDIYRGKRKDIRVEPTVQLASPIPLT